MAEYKALRANQTGKTLYSTGDVVEFDELPSRHWEEILTAEAKAA